MDYFSLLGLTPQFDLDLKALESSYFAAQRACHPDRFVGKPAAERAQAMQRSADVNRAYDTLKEPLARAQYLLHLRGIEVGTEHDTVKPSAELLTESMQWREEIAEAGTAAALQVLESALQGQVAASLTRLALTWREGMWNDMAEEALRLGYLLKAREAVAQRRKARVS